MGVRLVRLESCSTWQFSPILVNCGWKRIYFTMQLMSRYNSIELQMLWKWWETFTDVRSYSSLDSPTASERICRTFQSSLSVVVSKEVDGANGAILSKDRSSALSTEKTVNQCYIFNQLFKLCKLEHIFSFRIFESRWEQVPCVLIFQRCFVTRMESHCP